MSNHEYSENSELCKGNSSGKDAKTDDRSTGKGSLFTMPRKEEEGEAKETKRVVIKNKILLT